MIYTVTLNPSIDCVVHLNSFEKGITNRTSSEEYYFGGKGLNVSVILAELGFQSTALGFIAGFTGEAIKNGIRSEMIKTDFIPLKNGISRINVKIKAEEESEINCQGPNIDKDEFEMLIRKTSQIHNSDTIVLAGSIPNTLPDNTYETILKELNGRNLQIIVDASGKLLLNSLKYKPFLIKPNRQELAEIFHTEINNETDIETYARELQKLGAKNVLVSLGGEGALLIDEFGKKHRSGILKQKVINTVGSGDSMVAGFLAGYKTTNHYSYALKLGTACGNATAFSNALATKSKIDEIFKIMNKE